ncbi:MAG: hypothetical protein ACRDQY_07850, partial [Pseudonocardiaceae bacterium]
MQVNVVGQWYGAVGVLGGAAQGTKPHTVAEVLVIRPGAWRSNAIARVRPLPCKRSGTTRRPPRASCCHHAQAMSHAPA